MKSLKYWLLFPTLLAMLVACGKNNESGKSSAPIALPSVGNPYSVGTTPYSYQGINLQQVIQQNPCINGYGGYPSNGTPYNGERSPIQTPMTGFPSVVAAGDMFVGVTSYGDVAAVVGQAPGTPPLFVAYLCPRSFTQAGTGQIVGIQIGGKMPRCQFKPLMATIRFPGTNATADFRWLDGGNSMRQPFAPPICN